MRCFLKAQCQPERSSYAGGCRQENLACCVPRKSGDPTAVHQIAKFLRHRGLTHFAHRCDREASITAMINGDAGLLGCRAQKVTTDNDPMEFDYPVALVEDDGPDAPTGNPPKNIQEQMALL